MDSRHVALGRLLIAGSREELIEALDKLVEPKSRIWERISDLAIGYVVDAVLESRAGLAQGAREALDQLEG